VAPNETFDIGGPAGRLEALLMRPPEGPLAAAVVCHAHPLHGGMMHFKVVFRAAKALQHAGLAALRFNFRGVGRSEGAYDRGVGEQDDLRAALDEMGRRYPGLPLVVGGFSFGSSMALRVAASDPRPRAVFALGFPSAMVPGHAAFVEAIRVPRLFVQGEDDEYGSGAQIRELASRLQGSVSVSVVPDCDHFFHGQLDLMQDAVASWAATRPWEVS
jgi:alpha/beta superfamily hydrolase